MKVIYCPLCNAAVKVVYSGQSFSGWKKCQCGEPIYIFATEDGKAAAEALKTMLEKSRGNMVKMINYFVKTGDERRIEDIVFVAGKAIEPDIYKLSSLKVLDKIGFAYKINPSFQEYLENFAATKQPQSRDIIEDFLKGD